MNIIFFVEETARLIYFVWLLFLPLGRTKVMFQLFSCKSSEQTPLASLGLIPHNPKTATKTAREKNYFPIKTWKETFLMFRLSCQQYIFLFFSLVLCRKEGMSFTYVSLKRAPGDQSPSKTRTTSSRFRFGEMNKTQKVFFTPSFPFPLFSCPPHVTFPS